MKTQSIRTQSLNTYATSGNLALVQQEEQLFVVLEGGKAHSASLVRTTPQQRRAQRLARKAQQRRMDVRVFVAMALITVAVVAICVLSDVACNAAQTRAFKSQGSTYVTVNSGESLWSIAEDHPVSGRTTREVARWIARQNDLSSSVIYAGQRLQVPAQG